MAASGGGSSSPALELLLSDYSQAYHDLPAAAQNYLPGGLKLRRATAKSKRRLAKISLQNYGGVKWSALKADETAAVGICRQLIASGWR